MSVDITNTFPKVFSFPLPELRENGTLTPGDYAPSRAEFEERFVAMGDEVKRQFIYAGWNRHRTALLHAGVSETAFQLLNGSFTSSKIAPNDIDIAVEVPIVTLDEAHVHPAVDLLAGPDMKLEFQCDAYPIFSLPLAHPDYATVTGAAIKYWRKWFGCTRDKMEKGRVWATTGGLR